MVYHLSHKADLRRALIPLVTLAGLLPLGGGLLVCFPALRLPAGWLPWEALLELLSVLVGAVVFVVGWSVPRAETDRNARWLAAVFLGVATLDLSQLLYLPGLLGFVAERAGDRSIVFWLSARALAAGGLLAVAWRPWNRPCAPRQGRRLLVSILALVAALHVAVAYSDGSWPERGIGLASPLLLLEIGLVALQLGVALRLARQLHQPRERDSSALLVACLAFAVSELLHAWQRGPSGPLALAAHLYQLLGYGLVCRALVFDAVRQPYAGLEQARALRAAKEAAEQASAARSEFLAQMSHEIRTPLNAIMGLVHLAQATDPSPRQRGYLKRMEHSSRHLLGLVDEVLDFSRIDAGRLELEQVELELERVLEGVLDLSADMAARKGLELVPDLAADVPARLVGDPLRLGQILINYVSNAVKFTHHGEIVVGVQTVARDAREVLLRFSVRDTGIGLTPQQCEAVFERFRQADATTGRRYGGSGLGLAISRQLAALMGGEVGVDSRPGAGATFWFTARLGLASQQPVGDESAARPWSGQRVLLVDDNDGARAALARMLERLGLEVSTAASGSGALAELALAQTACLAPELVVLDFGMPGMDGLATAREIGRLGLFRPPALLLLTTTDSDHATVAQALAATAVRTEVIDKPVRFSALSRALARLLGGGTPSLAGDVPPPQAMVSLAGVRVLLVEDDELNRDIAREWLMLAGARVDLASDGEQALDQLQRQACDIVLMDMRLPGMDGLSATREIRKQAALASLPIIGMTANALKNDRERCLAVGMNDHIAKPVVPRELSAKLLQWLAPPGAPVTEVPVAGEAPDGAVHAAGTPGLDRRDHPLGQVRIDRSLGLMRAGGSESLYQALQARFATGQADAAQRIAQALAAADWYEAERLAHTLKGSAALIGASGLRELAGRLEQAIRERLAIVGALQRELETVLTEVLGSIAAQTPGAATGGQAVSALDEQAWHALSQRLQALLDDDDAASVELFHEYEVAIRARLGRQHEALARALHDFDFVTALDLLRATAVESSGAVASL